MVMLRTRIFLVICENDMLRNGIFGFTENGGPRLVRILYAPIVHVRLWKYPPPAERAEPRS